ncbi:hypothetical protein L1887_04433 [Cichorium endivia]|nr:hypothetical protein L1887_04433 [Cichorium endivia]
MVSFAVLPFGTPTRSVVTVRSHLFYQRTKNKNSILIWWMIVSLSSPDERVVGAGAGVASPIQIKSPFNQV